MKSVKHILTTLLCSCLAIATLSAGNAYPVSDIPVYLLSDAHTVIRQSSVDVFVKGTRNIEHRHRLVVTILNKHSSAHTKAIAYDQFSTIKNFKAEVFDREGTRIAKSRKRDIIDAALYDGFSIASDARMQRLNMQQARYPYTVAFEWTVVDKELSLLPNWYIQPSTNTAVQKTSYRIVVDEDAEMEVNVKGFGRAIPEPTITGNTREWQLSNLKAVVYEPYAPDDILSYMVVVPSQFEVEGRRGSLKAWSDYSAFMHALNEGREQVSPQMAAEARKLTEGASSDREKIEILYNYLQRNMRYVSIQLGIGGWQTFKATEVEANKYGDCKALTHFMKGMLAAVGIDATPALIGSGSDAFQHDPKFVNAAFNHVILYVPTESMWLECTSKTMPVGYITSGNQDRFALLVQPEGGQLVRTPTIEDNQLQTRIDLSLSEKGAGTAKVERIATGTVHDRYRYMRTSQKELREEIEDDVTTGALADVSDIQVEFEDRSPTARIQFDLSIEKFASKAGKRLFVPLRIMDNLPLYFPEDKARIHPVVRNHPAEYTSVLRLALPEGASAEAIPDGIELESPIGKYTLTIQKEDGYVVINRRLSLVPSKVEVDQYSQLVDFRKQIEKAEMSKVVILLP